MTLNTKKAVPKDLIGENGLLKQLTKLLDDEMSDLLCHGCRGGGS